MVRTLITLCFVFGMVQDVYKHYPPTNIDVAEVETTSDWELFTEAVIYVESKGDTHAVGKLDDVGVLQIRPIVVAEANRILGENHYTLEDRYSREKSIEMWNVIMDEKNAEHDKHFALKIWNPKAPIAYHRRVMSKYKELKNI